MERDVLIEQLKRLIVDECDTDYSVDEIENDELLMGAESRLGLDSLDALQISLAVKSAYDKRIEGGNETRSALTSINTLADFILS